MKISLSFYFSAITLLTGMLVSIYFFIDWLHHRKYKFSLYWSFGIFSFYLFHIPFVLANFGIGFMVTDYNFFYLITMPLSFIGAVLIYLGTQCVLSTRNSKKIIFFTVAWIFSYFLLFAYFFILGDGYITTSLYIASILLFFLPAYILILKSLWQWTRAKEITKSKLAVLGVNLMSVAIVFRIVEGIISIHRSFRYPPEFWFVAFTNFDELFIIQSLSTLLLVVGFLFMHKNCCGTIDSQLSK